MKSLPVMMIFWYVFPIILLFACNFIVQSLSLAKKFKLKAPDLATPFLLMGIHVISTDTFSVSAVPYVIILILLLGIGIAVSHAYYYGDIQYKRFFKMFWRIVFLITLLLYILLIILNISHYV